MTDALVYFIREDSGNVKIGVTANLKKRLKAIQTHNPHKMAVVKTIHCSNIQQAKKAEKELHKRFSEFRQNGEWFKLPEPVINELIGEGE